MWSPGKKEIWFALGCGLMVLSHPLHFSPTSEENGFFAYGCYVECQWLHINTSFVPCLCMRSASQGQSHSLCHFCASPASACALQQSLLISRAWFWEASEPPWACCSAGWGKAATLCHLSLPLWGPHWQQQLLVCSKEAFTSVCSHGDQWLGLLSCSSGAKDASVCVTFLFCCTSSFSWK